MHPPSRPPPALTPALLQQALSGGRGPRGQLAEAMIPIVHVRVGRLLLRAGASRRRDGRQEVEDFVQTVLFALFDKKWRALSEWNPQRGLSLANWVGLLAEHEVKSILRSRLRNPWTDEPTDEEEIDPTPSSEKSPESTLAALQHAGLILDRTRARITTSLGHDMFHLLFVEGLSVEDIQSLTGMKADQVYNWRSRLLGLLRKVAGEVAEEMRVEVVKKPRKLSGRRN